MSGLPSGRPADDAAYIAFDISESIHEITLRADAVWLIALNSDFEGSVKDSAIAWVANRIREQALAIEAQRLEAWKVLRGNKIAAPRGDSAGGT